MAVPAVRKVLAVCRKARAVRSAERHPAAKVLQGQQRLQEMQLDRQRRLLEVQPDQRLRAQETQPAQRQKVQEMQPVQRRRVQAVRQEQRQKVSEAQQELQLEPEVYPANRIVRWVEVQEVHPASRIARRVEVQEVLKAQVPQDRIMPEVWKDQPEIAVAAQVMQEAYLTIRTVR